MIRWISQNIWNADRRCALERTSCLEKGYLWEKMVGQKKPKGRRQRDEPWKLNAHFFLFAMRMRPSSRDKGTIYGRHTRPTLIKPTQKINDVMARDDPLSFRRHLLSPITLNSELVEESGNIMTGKNMSSCLLFLLSAVAWNKYMARSVWAQHQVSTNALLHSYLNESMS